MTASNHNPLGTRGTLDLGSEQATVYRLPELAHQGLTDLARRPSRSASCSKTSCAMPDGEP